MGAQTAGAQGVSDEAKNRISEPVGTRANNRVECGSDSCIRAGLGADVLEPEAAPLPEPEGYEKTNSNLRGTGGGADDPGGAGDTSERGPKLAELLVGADEAGVVGPGADKLGQQEIKPAPAEDLNCPSHPQVLQNEQVEIAPELPLANSPDDVFEDEFSRYELEFSERSGVTFVKLRERVRFTFDGSRPSWVLGVFRCGTLTPAQLEAVKAKTLPPDVRGALTEGEISYEVLKTLLERPGKGATRESRQAGERVRAAQVEHYGGLSNPSTSKSSRKRGKKRSRKGTKGRGQVDRGVYPSDITTSNAIN